MTTEHKRFGGSSAERWLNCPGATQLCETLPPQTENAFMAGGTRAHALLALALSERRATVLDCEGATIDARVGTPVFTLEDVTAVEVAVTHVNCLLEEDPDAVFWVERMFTLAPDVGGTADVVVWKPAYKCLHVIDYKHGAGSFVSECSPQLKLYAAAVMQDAVVDAEIVVATIIQPRFARAAPVRSVSYTRKELAEFTTQVATAVELARGVNPPLLAGGHCGYCPAAGACPAPLTALPADTSGAQDVVTLTLPAPERMRSDIRALAETLRALPALRAWINGVQACAEAAANAGRVLPGFKLVPVQAHRKWADPAAVRQWLTDELLDEDSFAPRELRSVAQVEPLVKAVLGAGGVTQLARFVTKESSGNKLVPDTAPGTAVDPLALAAGAFAGVVTIE